MKDSPATTWRAISLVLRWSSRTVEDFMCLTVIHLFRRRAAIETREARSVGQE
jgi:hypothetical protein